MRVYVTLGNFSSAGLALREIFAGPVFSPNWTPSLLQILFSPHATVQIALHQIPSEPFRMALPEACVLERRKGSVPPDHHKQRARLSRRYRLTDSQAAPPC